MKIWDNITQLIGNTPIVKLSSLDDPQLKGTILAKLESFNPASSVKDRIAKSMIDAAIKDGSLQKGTVLIEPTSGNTGVALAYIAASYGYKLILTMPDTMSVERRNLLSALGAELVLTDGTKGMKGAIDKATQMQAETKNSLILGQFDNLANPQIHRETTAREILEDTDGKLDAFVSGIGTGGTITGVGEVLKEHIKGIKVFAVEPSNSAVLSGKGPGPHKIQGIGAGFIPSVLNVKIYDEVIQVSNEEAMMAAKMLAQQEGILAGISSGAALYATMLVAKRDEFAGATILTILPDTGERYLSTDLFS
ncbi:MAG: cysteine synthase A [Bacteriovoracaceae bacterium]|nr:cysteine synthase A [Bacteriovoracaceae bacterium]